MHIEQTKASSKQTRSNVSHDSKSLFFFRGNDSWNPTALCTALQKHNSVTKTKNTTSMSTVKTLCQRNVFCGFRWCFFFLLSLGPVSRSHKPMQAGQPLITYTRANRQLKTRKILGGVPGAQHSIIIRFHMLTLTSISREVPHPIYNFRTKSLE